MVGLHEQYHKQKDYSEGQILCTTHGMKLRKQQAMMFLHVVSQGPG